MNERTKPQKRTAEQRATAAKAVGVAPPSVGYFWGDRTDARPYGGDGAESTQKAKQADGQAQTDKQEQNGRTNERTNGRVQRIGSNYWICVKRKCRIEWMDIHRSGGRRAAGEQRRQKKTRAARA